MGDPPTEGTGGQLRTLLDGATAAVGGLAAFVYLCGRFVTATRYSAARIPVEVAGGIDQSLLLGPGLRAVALMTVAFVLLLLVGYSIVLPWWAQTAPQWHSVAKHGRFQAAMRHPASWRPRDSPLTRLDAPVGDPFVRVIAGYTVMGIAAAAGIAAATLAGTVASRVSWLQPTVFITVFAACALGLGALGPLWGNRLVHLIVWLGAIAVALLAVAPVGAIVFILIFSGGFGPPVARLMSRGPRPLTFLRSPLPWMIVALYGLVAVAVVAVPPVTFPEVVVTSSTLRQTGAYVARTGDGVYVVTCRARADRLSTHEQVLEVQSSTLKTLRFTGGTYAVDSGERPSLATLIMSAFGVHVRTPSLYSFGIGSRTKPCGDGTRH